MRWLLFKRLRISRLCQAMVENVLQHKRGYQTGGSQSRHTFQPLKTYVNPEGWQVGKRLVRSNTLPICLWSVLSCLLLATILIHIWNWTDPIETHWHLEETFAWASAVVLHSSVGLLLSLKLHVLSGSNFSFALLAPSLSFHSAPDGARESEPHNLHSMPPWKDGTKDRPKN